MSVDTHSGDGDRDRLVEDLTSLADVPIEVLQRTVISVAVVHQLDARGRCQQCRPRRHLRGFVSTCPTRELLRLAVCETGQTRWRST
ncbi:MAG TPA: hypothetical protein VIS06_12535 [Mycobacteriales bacterium]